MKHISEALLEHKVLKSLAMFKTGIPHTGTAMVCSGALP